MGTFDECPPGCHFPGAGQQCCREGQRQDAREYTLSRGTSLELVLLSQRPAPRGARPPRSPTSPPVWGVRLESVYPHRGASTDSCEEGVSLLVGRRGAYLLGAQFSEFFLELLSSSSCVLGINPFFQLQMRQMTSLRIS